MGMTATAQRPATPRDAARAYADTARRHASVELERRWIAQVRAPAQAAGITLRRLGVTAGPGACAGPVPPGAGLTELRPERLAGPLQPALPLSRPARRRLRALRRAGVRCDVAFLVERPGSGEEGEGRTHAVLGGVRHPPSGLVLWVELA